MIPYQAHSETSRQAALRVNSKQEAIAKMLQMFTAAGIAGLTGDDLYQEFTDLTHRGTISARLIELERDRKIVKTSRTRKSRARRQCAVYVLSAFADGKEKSPKRPNKHRDIAALENIAAIFFTLIRNNQLPSGDSKITVTPFDVAVLNNLAKRAEIQGMKVSLGQVQQV